MYTEFTQFWFQGTEGLVEFRFRNDTGIRGREFVRGTDLTEQFLSELIARSEREHWNLFCGVCTRTSDQSGKEENVLEVPGLWVDIDLKHMSNTEATRRLNELSTPPSVTVLSGNGIHGYFKFDRPYLITTEDERSKLKTLSARLHRYLNADSTHNLDRVLRFPGSSNFKDLANVKRSSILEFTGTVYRIDEFDYLPKVEIDSKQDIAIEEITPVELDALRVPAYIKRLIEEGYEVGRRSEKIFAVTCAMLEREHSYGEIAYVLTNEDWDISEKILEKAEHYRLPYVANTISSALQRLDKPKKARHPIGKASEAAEPRSILEERDDQYYRNDNRLSNFIILPTERITVDGADVIKGEIKIAGGLKIPILLNHKVLITKKDLLNNIPSSQISWLGTDKDIQFLREHLNAKHIKRRHGVGKIGLHGELFITPKEVWGRNGLVDDSSLVYVPKFQQQTTGMERSISAPPSDDWSKLAFEVVKLLPQINDTVAIYSMIGWHMIAPVAPFIRELADGGFPQLNIWGIKGSGKTSSAEVFGKMFSNKEIRSCNRPAFSIMREADAMNAIPLYLDEYRPGQMSPLKLNEIHHIALLAYKAETDARGRQDQSTVDYSYTAPIVWMGETPFTQPNLLERIIMVKLSPQALNGNSERKQAFRSLNTLDLQGFLGGYLYWLFSNEMLNYIEGFFNGFRDLIEQRRANLPDRISNNITVMLTGLAVYRRLAMDLGVVIQDIPFNDIIDGQIEHLTGQDAVGSLDRLMVHTDTMTKESYFTGSQDYIYDKSKGLLLKTTSWMAALRRFCQTHGYTDDLYTDAQVRNFLTENRTAGGYVIESQSRSYFNGKQARCTIIDPVKLEEQLGIPTSTWE